jgi:ParB/RepB/Spo0J family partition protein
MDTVAADIPLSKIDRNPKQPREEFPSDHIEKLAASIKERGLIQPITVRKIKGGRFQIVTGECRFRAHKLLDLKTIRAQIVDIDDREMMLRAMVENLQRRDMNPIEEAKAFRCLLDQNYTIPQIVAELGLKSPALVNQRLMLLDLTPEIQKLVGTRNLPVSMAVGVAQVSQERQVQLVRNINAGRLTTSEQVRHAGIAIREAEAQIDVFADRPKASQKDLASLRRLEEKIEQIAAMVQLGFRDGECVAAQRVSPDRVKTMSDKLALIRKHILQMEHDLRCAAAQGEILLEIAS